MRRCNVAIRERDFLNNAMVIKCYQSLVDINLNYLHIIFGFSLA